MMSLMNAPILQTLSSQMEKSMVSENSSEESEPAQDEKRFGYAGLELPYSKQNFNFKSRVTRIGRDLIFIGVIICLLRTGYISQWMAHYITETKEVQRSWIKSWFTQETQQEQNTMFSKFISRLPPVSTKIPGLGYAVESSLWTARILKSFAQNSIGWLTILEDHLPDIGVSLFVIGGFLFLMGSTLILRDNWVSSLAITNCTRCWADANKSKMADLQEETLAKRDVELAVPIFKFVKVFPFHKRFSGTTDFSLNSVKMKLIIQFNRATQTA